MFEEQRAAVQRTLDELFSADLIPFQLSARVIDSIGGDEYIVRFQDSRLRSVDISWQEGQSFRDIFRHAILDRITRLNN